MRVILILALTLFAPAAPKPVELLARPTIMLARGDVRVEARVARDASNRLLVIAWASDHGTAGETTRPLEGEDAAVLHVLTLPSQPAANYIFVASVFDNSGKLRGRAEAKIVTPDDGRP